MRTACEQSFKTTKAPRTLQKNKSVPWWTQELTAMRKTTNYLRRKYQRTRNNKEQREKNKATYFEQKSKYAATIKTEKTKSWKEYCNLTFPSLYSIPDLSFFLGGGDLVFRDKLFITGRVVSVVSNVYGVPHRQGFRVKEE
jgi:hypothetical protein